MLHFQISLTDPEEAANAIGITQSRLSGAWADGLVQDGAEQDKQSNLLPPGS